MTQDQFIILLFKIATVADIAAIIWFIGTYTVLAEWWRNEIGRTIVIKDLLLLIMLLIALISLFLHFNRLTSNVSGWIDIVAYFGIGVVMAWRSYVFIRIHKRGSGKSGSGSDEDSVV